MMNSVALILPSFSPQAFDLTTVTVDLPLLVIVAVFLALHLIADQGAGAQPEPAADQRSRRWMTHSAPDDPSRNRATHGADSSPLFSGRKRPARTTHSDQRRNRDCGQAFDDFCFHCFFLLFFTAKLN